MKCSSVIFSLVLIFSSFVSENSATFDKAVGYYSGWFTDRIGDGKFDIESINPKLYTHLIFAFVGITENGNIFILDHNNNTMQSFVDLKKKNKKLKVLVAIRGSDAITSSSVFSHVSKDPIKRKALVDHSLQFVKQYGFDGFELDWEYPGKSGDPEDRTNYALWFREFHEEYKKHGLLLAAGVTGAEEQITTYYNVTEIDATVDFINLMTFDINDQFKNTTAHNAPMSGVRNWVDDWITAGMRPEKIIMGVAASGHSYTLANPAKKRVGAASLGPGDAGPYIDVKGSPLYNEIVVYIKSGTWKLKYDRKEQVPYMYKGNQWVSYDDERSTAIKVQYAKSKKLGGIMLWSVDMDDFRGVSGEVNKLQMTILRNMNLSPQT